MFFVKSFEELSKEELYEILKARSEVFVVEQNIVYQDMDGIDYKALHIFSKNENGKITSYLRAFKKEDEENTVKIGRVLTVERGTGLGKKLLDEAVKTVFDYYKCDEIYIEAQSYAKGFYEKAGFIQTSGEFLEEGIMHIQMRLKKNG